MYNKNFDIHNFRTRLAGLVLAALMLAFFTVSEVNAQKGTPVKDVAAFKSKLKEMSSKIQSIQSDFTQEKHLTLLDDKVISQGKFSFKKKNMLRWEYTTPFPYIIIINEDEMKIKDEEHVSTYDMESNKMFGEINNMMVGMVDGSILESKDFSFAFFESSDSYFVEMKPNRSEMKEFLSEIDITIKKSEFFVSKLVMKEPGEDFTVLEFYNEKLNQEIPASRFTLVK